MVGSQLVGLVPLKALLDAAAFYCEKENLFILEEEHRIRLVSCAPKGGICGRVGSRQRAEWEPLSELQAAGAGLGAGSAHTWARSPVPGARTHSSFVLLSALRS